MIVLKTLSGPITGLLVMPVVVLVVIVAIPFGAAKESYEEDVWFGGI